MAFRLRWPTEFDFITQKFGARPEVYKEFGLPGHEGLDFQAPTGSKVFACAAGVVDEVRFDCGNRLKCPYGNQVRIVHQTDEGEFTTVYAHLQGISVAAGQFVEAGQLIGLADSTGNSDGAHLHLTLKRKGATHAGLTQYPSDIIDPTPFLDPFQGDGENPSMLVSDLRFQADITVPDESIMNPGQQFVKTWRVLNRGTTTWGDGYALAFFRDKQMGGPDDVPLPHAKPGEAVQVSVPLMAPETAGFHRSTWQAKDPQGNRFGQPLFALIKVPATDEDLPLNGLVDLSHYNTIHDLKAVREDGIVGIIHKATQGLEFVDERYVERRDEARDLGFLWGAYHFGEGGDPIGEANHFLDTVKPDDKTLLVLDFERNPLGKSMDLFEAEAFVEHIRDKTGRLPVLYTGRWYVREFLGENQPTKLSECPLWIASYRDVPLLPDQWDTWTFWQYTNGSDGPGPHQVEGIGRCDRNKFNGSLDDLKDFWGA